MIADQMAKKLCTSHPPTEQPVHLFLVYIRRLWLARHERFIVTFLMPTWYNNPKARFNLDELYLTV